MSSSSSLSGAITLDNLVDAYRDLDTESTDEPRRYEDPERPPRPVVSNKERFLISSHIESVLDAIFDKKPWNEELQVDLFP